MEPPGTLDSNKLRVVFTARLLIRIRQIGIQGASGRRVFTSLSQPTMRFQVGMLWDANASLTNVSKTRLFTIRIPFLWTLDQLDV